MLAEHGGARQTAKPVLEVNPTHPLIAALASGAKARTGPDRGRRVAGARRGARADGDAPADAAAFAARLSRVLTRAAQAPGS